LFGDNEAGALSVEFRTDGAVGECRYIFFAVCFDPLTLNAQGCTIPNVTEARKREVATCHRLH